MSNRLTFRSVEAAQPDPDKRLEISDAAMPGLYLVVQPSGAKSWAVRYRFDRRPRKLTLGRYPALSLADARSRAAEAIRLVDLGEDPGERKRRSQTERLSNANKVSTLIEQFEKRHLSQLRRGPDVRRMLDRFIIPAWGDRSIETIRRRDVVELLDDIVDSGRGVTANRVLAHVRKFFNWAVERDIIDSSPAFGLRSPAKETSRDRVLSDEEIRQLWKAANSIGPPFGAMTQILLLTGQRLREVAGMSDRELIDGSWQIPAERSKNGVPHVVPLPSLALELLEHVPRLNGCDLLFTTTGNTPVSGFSKAMTRLRAAMPDETPQFGFHDLRRTAASGMAQLGQPVHVVEAVLNHRSGSVSGIAAVYNRYDYEPEKRAALEAWAEQVRRLIDG